MEEYDASAIYSQDHSKDTFLHIFMANNRKEDVDLNIIDRLLKEGANINTQNIYGDTPLHTILDLY